RGVYREVKPPSRLVYTWGWHGDPAVEFGETLVTVDFLDKEGFTEVQITHDRFPNPEVRDKHNHGWNGSLDKLEERLSSAADSTQLCAQPGSFCWNELLAVDPSKAAGFYTKLFGWSTEQMPGGMNYTLFKQGEKSVGGLMARPNPQAPPHWLPYVMVENVDVSSNKAGELGARLLMPPTDIPTVGRIAVFLDPEGAPLGVFQPEKQ
ncbi:MAG: SRPBCC domain-containing protein, partial [Candidatus Dormibacteraceae bacterium]